MDALVRTKLRQLILDHGRTLSADPKRCEAMLKDCCPAHRREIAALIVALGSRVATDLLAPPAGQPTGVLLNRLVQRLLDDHPMTEDAARWAVETWALALGVIDAPLAPEPAPTAPAPKPTPPPKAPAVHTPPKTTDPGPPDIHGWPADQVQALQRQAAAALGMPVVFRDPEFRVRIRRQVKTGERQRWFRDPEPIFEEREVVTAVAPPEMVIIPAGRFLMGSPDNEHRRSSVEGPQHPVAHAHPFAIGRYAVTFDDYDAFCTASGRALPADAGWGRGRRPVINVSWDDAQAYCQWLSQQTGQIYRLPSEAEWEYACRAGTVTPFSTGNCIETNQANYRGLVDYNNCGARTGVYLAKTQPVGSYPANLWGLHEINGNVWEWVEDCWNDDYAHAPSNGSAWRCGNCASRVVRGGCWNSFPRSLCAAVRGEGALADRVHNLGFRLARTLTS